MEKTEGNESDLAVTKERICTKKDFQKFTASKHQYLALCI